MTTAQAVTPGQGQTVRVAGVRVGDISSVDLENGHAVVTMDIDRKFLPVYKDATILLRPKTGLKDMFLELDPGTNYDPIERRRVPERRHDPGRQHRAGHERRPDPRRARRRHAGLPAAAAHPGRRGPERPRQGPRQAARQPRPDQPRPRPPQHRGRQAQGEPRHADPQHEPALGQGRPGRPGHPAARLGLGPGPRRDRQPVPGRPAHGRPARADPADDPVALGKTDQLATVLGPAINSLRPFARKLKPINDSLGEPRQDDLPAGQERHPAVRAQRPPARAEPEAGGQEPGRRRPRA